MLRSCRRSMSFAPLLAFVATACSPGTNPGDAGTADTSSVADTQATDVTTAMDTSSTDVITPPPDSGASDARVVPPGCDPERGITCSGDWTTHCTPGCAPTECCSPQHGAFACVARDSAGHCPAADLFVDAARVSASVRYEFHNFDATSCAVVEHCVEVPGRRHLLRFDSRTPNTGTADMFLGPPSRTDSNFEFSTCHNHYHFNSYAAYQLRAADGTIVARGHKQAYCLIDLDRYSTSASPTAHYNCSNQGIQMGWADIYNAGLDCQWVDVTDVAPGNYTLRININIEHLLNESDYTNNQIEVPVTIVAADPMADPTAACATDMMGVDRDCGWTVSGGVHTCTPGATVSAGCSERCSLGSCTGDTMIRSYEGDHTGPGALRGMSPLGQNDDSGCPGTGNDLCSLARFNCPASGQYTVAVAPYRSAMTAVCNLATSP